MTRGKRLSIGAVAVAIVVSVLSAGAPAVSAATAPTVSPKALVLYDTTGPWGYLGELYATQVSNLTGHFGGYTAEPVSKYKAGEISQYTATIYIGSTYDEPLSAAFLDDVYTATRPVIWIHDNIWELTARKADFQAKYGYMWWQFDPAVVTQVQYKGTTLTRDPLNGGGIMEYSALDTTKATVLANAVRPDGTTFPWALRSGNLTYLGENPFAYVNETDRSMIFSDLLFDALAPTTAARHRALVRLEDVGPDSDPQDLRDDATYLAAQKVPFSFGVYPRYKDPLGVNNNGKAEEYALKDRPQMVSAIKYAISKGGTPIMHGWTHQYGKIANPYSAVSADDFEFFMSHVDDGDNVIYDGPVPVDSTAWALSRVLGSAADFAAAKLPIPTIFEFPHYAGSAIDYKAISSVFTTRYERSLYFKGQLSGTTIDKTQYVGQFFPYVVKDVYGTKVLPENLGNFEPDVQNNHPARTPEMIIATAKQNLVVRDGFASFFYHPYYGIAGLKTTVAGIKALGYTFVAPTTL